VYAFEKAFYTSCGDTIDVYCEVEFKLSEGDYRFRSDLNGTQFWSGETNHCRLPGCTETSVTVTVPVTLTVQSTGGEPYADLPVYAFDGDIYTGHYGTSD